MSQVVLHQWEVSPFCGKIRRALTLKGIFYTTKDYNGLLALTAPRQSEVGTLPVLEIDGKKLQDSTRICRYLDIHYPEPLLYPEDPEERALAELWEDWADEALYFYEMYFRWADADALDSFIQLICLGRPSFEKMIVKQGIKLEFKRKLNSQGLGRMSREQVEEEFFRHLDRIDSILAKRDWLVGERQSVADIAVGSQLLEIQRTCTARIHQEIDKRIKLAAWLLRL